MSTVYVSLADGRVEELDENGKRKHTAAPETAESLIERMERECNCRIDSNGFDNAAVAGVMGYMARALGESTHRPEDDVVAGTLIRHQMTPEYAAQQRANAALASLLVQGVSPDDIKTLHDALK